LIGSCSSAAISAAGDTCTRANSKFQLTNGLVDSGTGLVYTGSSGTSYNAANVYIGTLATQQAIRAAAIQSILSTISSGGAVNASQAATLTPTAVTSTPAVITPTPEPLTLFLIGAGLIGIACLKRNRERF
jgi:hypothetical protein